MQLDDIIANFATLSLDAISIGYCPRGETWARHVWSNAPFHEMFGARELDFKDRRIELVFDPELIPVEPTPKRAFQGWRYLKPEDAPPDLKAGSGTIEMPANLRAELRDAMVW